MTRIEVTKRIDFSINLMCATLRDIPAEAFFVRKNDKWSPAEQAQHLVLSIKPLQLAYQLPGFLLQLMFGKMNRNNKTYEQLHARYHEKLKEGATASAPYIPKQLKTGTSPEKVIQLLQTAHAQLVKKVARKSEKDLDTYVLPHPLLGKISLREMLYFTDFHILHHDSLTKSLYVS